jgi:hypothetical protein
MGTRAGRLIDQTLRRLHIQSNSTNPLVLQFVSVVFSEVNFTRKFTAFLRLFTVIYQSSDPNLQAFFCCFLSEEPSAPKSVKQCIKWYPPFSAQRKRLQKAQETSIHDFSMKLSTIQQTLRELATRFRTERRSHEQETEALRRELDELKVANGKVEMMSHGKHAVVEEVKSDFARKEENLRFEIETLKEKCRIMRNDLNFVMKQKVEVEAQLAQQRDLFRQKSAECLTLRTMLNDKRAREE